MFTLNLLDLKSLGCTFCAGGVLHIEEPTSMLCPCVLTQDPLLVHPAVSQTDSPCSAHPLRPLRLF